MTIPSSRSLIFEVKSTWSELAFIQVLRLRTSSEDFELLRKTSDFFGNLRKWSCRLQKSQHSQDINLTHISQEKLAGILSVLINQCLFFTFISSFTSTSSQRQDSRLCSKNLVILRPKLCNSRTKSLKSETVTIFFCSKDLVILRPKLWNSRTKSLSLRL